MKRPVVVVGLGQLGTFFAEAFLRLEHPIVPVLRQSNFTEEELRSLDPALVVIAVREDDLTEVLEGLPRAWGSRVVLLQNELRPSAWAPLRDPTVCIVWFERKEGARPTVVLPSVLSGPMGGLVKEALDEMNIPSHWIEPDELDVALCLKNLYILGLNFAGLELGGPAGDLMGTHQTAFEPLFDELVRIETALFEHPFERHELWSELSEAIAAEPNHATRGRTALRRLERTLHHARARAIPAPILEALALKHLRPPRPDAKS